MPMVPHTIICPDKHDPVMTLQLDSKTGSIPKGAYGFIEFYCTDRGCDCRRTTLFVLNEKMQEKAVISIGFDMDDPIPGPFLDDFHKQSKYADQILEIFVQLINQHPEFIEAMHRHYCEVRTKVEGKKYRGKAFPKPGTFMRRVTEPPEMPVDFLDFMESEVSEGPRTTHEKKNEAVSMSSIASFADLYYEIRNQSRFDDHHAIQSQLRRYILDHDTFALEISAILVNLGSNDTGEAERVNAALRVLYDILEILRVELERQRAGSTERMERLQNTLAQKIYVECGDTNLCAAVSHTLLQSRVELLQALHDANGQRMLLDSHNTGLRESSPEDIMEGLCKSIEKMGADSPFEALENLLQLLALGPPDMQTALCGELLLAKSHLVRDTAALMILHPRSEVRLGVSTLLAEDSSNITSETLRRLIITRNWFPEEIKKNIDVAISNARRARISCASLVKNLDATIYASPVDGAFAQSFQTIIPDGKGYKSCSVLLKRGTGVADAFVIPLPTKKDLNEFLSMMKQQGAFLEVSVDYLDQRICHSLAEGAALGKAPIYWLACVAEVLGKDQWIGVPFDACRELAYMRADLEKKSPALLEEKSRKKALKESAEWCGVHDFADSWFEDDSEVDAVITKALKRKNKNKDSEWIAVNSIIENILEKNRNVWIERLTLNAMWLKASKKPSLPWHQMFHIAESVTDTTLQLKEIPLMESIAVQSLGAYFSRKEEGYRPIIPAIREAIIS